MPAKNGGDLCPIFNDPGGAYFNHAVTFHGGIAGSGLNGKLWFVDGSLGSDTNDGKTWATAKATIQAAVTAASGGDTILIAPKAMAAGATDPGSYAETIIIPATHESLSLIGASRGRTQGGLPQIKKGSGTTAHLTIRAPGCLIANLGFNGAGATGGGILLDDDSSTKTAFGTTIKNCHFKNLKGSGNASTGGAIMWSANGGAWQCLIEDCLFYNCRAGIVLLGTAVSIPQDVVIRGCVFSSNANTSVDCDIYIPGDGMTGLVIEDCKFATVDVPAYATSPAAARYLDLTGCKGTIAHCTFACLGSGTGTKTWKAAGDAAKIPATMRMVHLTGELVSDATVTDIVRAA